jgi:hypothetical protein
MEQRGGCAGERHLLRRPKRVRKCVVLPTYALLVDSRLRHMYISLTVNLELPKGSVIVDISPHRLSYWTRTARIRTLDPEENEVSYFLKVSQQDTSLQRF